MPETLNNQSETNSTPPVLPDPWAVEPFPHPAARPIPIDESGVEVFRSRDEFRDALVDLPQQAVVIVKLRAEKRLEVLLESRRVDPETVAAGSDSKPRSWYDRSSDDADSEPTDAAADAAACAADAAYADAAYADDAYADDAHAYDDAYDNAWRITSLDFARVRKLFSPESTPRVTGWDDPRLGPLWPDGTLERHRQFEKGIEKAQLASRPDPSARPIPAETLAQIDDYRVLNRLCESGELAVHAGEYVLVYRGQVVGHGKDLGRLRRAVAEKHGIPEGHLACRYVY